MVVIRNRGHGCVRTGATGFEAVREGRQGGDCGAGRVSVEVGEKVGEKSLSIVLLSEILAKTLVCAST